MPLQVTIEKLVYGGEGLARTEEGIVLVPGALPGEKATIEVEPARRGVRRARLIEVAAPSTSRITPSCPYFAVCGGCQHQQITYEQQLEWKRAILQECFERIGKLKLTMPIGIISAEPWEYRNRVRLHAGNVAGNFVLGFERPSSNEICAVNSCAISSPAIQGAVQTLSSGMLFADTTPGSFEIELFASDGDREMMATVTASTPPPKDFGDRWQAAMTAFSSISWRTRRDDPARRDAPPQFATWGGGGLTVRVGNYHFRVSHGSFFQTNRYLLSQMIDTALSGVQGQKALDLYAGVGFFTLPLARHFDHVVAVESHPAAAVDLQANSGVSVGKIHTYFSTSEVFLTTRAARQSWDLVLVDPPRHGLTTTVRSALADLRPSLIAYVSCDPTTLARDVASLCAAGYKVTEIHLIDLFPQTYHLEAIVRLSR